MNLTQNGRFLSMSKSADWLGRAAAHMRARSRFQKGLHPAERDEAMRIAKNLLSLHNRKMKETLQTSQASSDGRLEKPRLRITLCGITS